MTCTCNKEDQLVDIVVLVDRSGSMFGMEDETIGALNAFIKEQKKLPGEARLTTVFFDNQYDIIHNLVDLQDVDPITRDEYFCRGATSMYDAIGRAICSIQVHNKSNKVVFLIQSDGQENTSVEYTATQIKTLIKAKEDQGWDFTFIGTGVDAMVEGSKYGMDMNKCFTLDKTAAGMRNYGTTMSVSSTEYRSKSTLDLSA